MHPMGVFVCFGAIYRICCMLWKNRVKFLREVGLAHVDMRKKIKIPNIWTLFRWFLERWNLVTLEVGCNIMPFFPFIM